MPGVETREHLFLRGEGAQRVWELTAAWFPGLPSWNIAVSNLEARIRFWHRCLCRTNKPHASAVIPCLVLWFLWSERNSNIHRNTSFSAGNVFNRIKMYLQHLISAGRLNREQWKGCGNLEDFNTSTWRERPRKQIRQVRWIPHDETWIKLNTAGEWRLSEVGAGGVIRDADDNIVRGFAANIVAASGLEANLQALDLGLDIAKELGSHIWIEVDAKEVANLFISKRYGAANLRHLVIAIRNKLRQLEFRITHIPSQGNTVAKFLAQHGNRGGESTSFGQISAPAMAKALARMDQLGLPSFRLREGNHSHY